MKWMLSMAALAAAAAAGGCASGDLTIDAMVTNVMNTVTYRLEPTGKLTVSSGGGAVEGETAAAIHTAQVDPAGMARLKKVVADSGFLLASPPMAASLNEGPSLRLEVTLGMWHNVARLEGAGWPARRRSSTR